MLSLLISKISFSNLGLTKFQLNQEGKELATLSMPCVINYHSLILGRKPENVSGWYEEGFSGCMTKLMINSKQRIIRQYDGSRGKLGACFTENVEKNTVEERACEPGYMTLNSEILLNPAFSRPLNFSIKLSKVHTSVRLITLGTLKVVATKKRVIATCKEPHQDPLHLNFRSFIHQQAHFNLELEVFRNYISVNVKTDSKSSTKLIPCDINTSNEHFIVGANKPDTNIGCIKKQLT